MFPVDVSISYIPAATMVVAAATHRGRLSVVLSYVFASLQTHSWPLWWVVTFLYLALYLYTQLVDATS